MSNDPHEFEEYELFETALGDEVQRGATKKQAGVLSSPDPIARPGAYAFPKRPVTIDPAPLPDPLETRKTAVVRVPARLKPRYDLIPPHALEAVARVLAFGAKKHGDRDWESRYTVDQCFEKAQRHQWAVRSGKKLDDETDEHGFAHAICDLLFALEKELE